MPLRATVYENPYARIPCAREIFHGSFDEVWGLDGEHVKRLYVGEELQKIEKNLDLE